MPQHHTIIAGVIGAGVTLVAAHQMLDQRRAQAEAEEREAEFQRRTAAHEEQNERARAEGEERERIEEDIFIRGMMHLAEAMHAGLVQEVARLARRLEQSARSALALPLIKLDGGGDSAAEVVIGFCLALGSDLDPLKALVSHPPPGTAMGSLGAASLGALIALLREKSASPSPGGEKWIGDVSLEVAMMLVYSFDARRHSDGRGEPAARVIDWVVPSDQDSTASPQERRRAAVLAARKLGLFAAPRNAFRFEESSRGMGWYTCPWTSNLQDKARQAADEWAEGTEWRKSELLVTNFDLAVVGNGRLARSGFRIGYSEQERGKYTINLQDVKGRGAQPLSVRQVDVSLCAYVLASKQLATTCSVLADRLQEALDEAQRGGGEGTVSLEHCCALSGSLEVAKHGLLRKLRDFDEDLLATHEQQVREQIRAGLLRSLEGACTWEGGEPVPAAVLRTEVDSFADSYCSLLSLRLQLTPRLDNGRTPSQSVAPQAVNMAVFDRLPWMNSMPPERLAMRRILEEDEKRRDDAAHTLGSLPAWYRRAYAGALLALYGLFVYWMYLCLALVVPIVRLLGPWGSISMDVATVDAGPDPVVANLNVGWTLVMLLAAADFGLYTMNTLFVALVHYRLVKATDTVRHSASAPWLMFGLRYVGVQRESFDAANSLRFDVFGRLASWRRWPQPLYRDLSDLEADCAGQFGVWVGRLASTRFNEALRRRAIGCHEAVLLIEDLLTAARAARRAAAKRAAGGGGGRKRRPREERGRRSVWSFAVHLFRRRRRRKRKAGEARPMEWDGVVRRPGEGAAVGEAADSDGEDEGEEAEEARQSVEEDGFVGFALPGTLEEQDAFLALPVHEDSEAAAEAASSSSLLTVAFGDAMAPLERAYQPGSRLGWSGDGEAEGAALRFGVGARVECQMGAGRWAPGRVTEAGYEDRDGEEYAYQVQLDDGDLIKAPLDDDECIRAARRAPVRGRTVKQLLEEGGWVLRRGRKHNIYKRTVGGVSQTYTQAATPSDRRSARTGSMRTEYSTS